jgi:uncharacterized protein YbjT (DUF2867 family)
VNFARMARNEGIERVIYLGGLGDRPTPSISAVGTTRRYYSVNTDRHLPISEPGWSSGRRSESYRTLRYLVQRLPAMIAPAWLQNPTQPIAVADTLSYLVKALELEASAGREVQIGGPEVLTYAEMLDWMAEVLGLPRRPRIPVPLITPWLAERGAAPRRRAPALRI